jgi:quercetin 2,3-dioxygenase
MTARSVQRSTQAVATLEGAGVRLHRAFGFGDTATFDPFLLLDDFRSDRPEDHRQGFPWHPHRGMETITYLLAGSVEHQDSMGNNGVIGPGDVQWMTAGQGIIHQEMPQSDAQGRVHGFQLWANLPAKLKLTAPHYQEIKAVQIPTVEGDGASVRVVCGAYRGQRGPVEGIAAQPSFLDVQLSPGVRWQLPIDADHQLFAYVFEGSGSFDATAPEAGNRTLLSFGAGDSIDVRADAAGVRFLLVSGAPLREPVAWRGPIVMNTQQELRQAFAQLQDGTFLENR